MTGHRRYAKYLLLTLLVGSLAGTAACRTAQPDRPVTYADMVEKAYGDAEKAFESKDYLEAIRRYNGVRNQFPYSRFAALADLRIADAYFEQEQYASAIEQYRSFVRLHPQHEQIVYAYYRISLSFYEQMPEDWWFMPPAHEKDLSRTRDAVRELQLFLRYYSDTEYAKDARRMLARARRRLADHEMYVAEFYLKRNNPRAAVGRLTHLLRNYSGLGLDPQALFLLGRAYLQLGEVQRAITALEDLIEVHPDHELAREARKYLERHRS